jgi:hypothetical protein
MGVVIPEGATVVSYKVSSSKRDWERVILRGVIVV